MVIRISLGPGGLALCTTLRSPAPPATVVQHHSCAGPRVAEDSKVANGVHPLWTEFRELQRQFQKSAQKPSTAHRPSPTVRAHPGLQVRTLMHVPCMPRRANAPHPHYLCPATQGTARHLRRANTTAERDMRARDGVREKSRKSDSSNRSGRGEMVGPRSSRTDAILVHNTMAHRHSPQSPHASPQPPGGSSLPSHEALDDRDGGVPQRAAPWEAS